MKYHTQSFNLTTKIKINFDKNYQSEDIQKDQTNAQSVVLLHRVFMCGSGENYCVKMACISLGSEF